MRQPTRQPPDDRASSWPALWPGVALALSLVFGSPSAQAQGWPAIKMPAGARSEVVASDMVLNGMPCRMLRFATRGSGIADVQTFYRAEFGPKRVVENRVEGDPVIATKQGDYFITVRLHSLPGVEAEVEGTVMTTLAAGKPSSSAVLVDTKSVFPPDTQVVSSIQTNDAGKRSLIVVGVNRDSVNANRDHVIDALMQRGFRLTKQPAVPAHNNPSSSLWLQLSSSSEEASVTVSDSGPTRSVVINRIRDAK